MIRRTRMIRLSGLGTCGISWLCTGAELSLPQCGSVGIMARRFTAPGQAIMPKPILITLLLTLLFSIEARADDKAFPGIQSLMQSEEFSAAGLDRLSDEEMKALNAWLLRYTAGEAAILRVHSEEVREASMDFELLSRIRGDFRGWSGETIFRLENGQIWRQRLQSRHAYTGPPNPEVRITRNWMGFYKLTLVETGKGVGVKLVR